MAVYWRRVLSTSHTHDDTVVIRQPQMLPKLSQGVTTVIVGNCGISASPVSLRGDPPDPMNLLGNAEAFAYPRFLDYRARWKTLTRPSTSRH
jgi:N-acyl-D-amino-acid deacylase